MNLFFITSTFDDVLVKESSASRGFLVTPLEFISSISTKLLSRKSNSPYQSTIPRPLRNPPSAHPKKMYRNILRTSLKPITKSPLPIPLRTYSAHATPEPFNWEDPLGSQNLFTDEELAISETAESYCQERMLPRVLRKCPVKWC